jgi:hypothetical protein
LQGTVGDGVVYPGSQKGGFALFDKAGMNALSWLDGNEVWEDSGSVVTLRLRHHSPCRKLSSSLQWLAFSAQ